MPPITFTMASMSLAEFKALNWAFLRKNRKGLLFAPLFGMAIVLVNLNVDAKYKAQSIGLFTGVTLLSVVPLLYGVLLFGLNRGIKKAYANTSALADGMTVVLEEEYIIQRSCLTHSQHPWPTAYKKAVKTGQWIILSSGPASAYFLDTERIEAPSTLADVEALFRRKGIAYTH